MAPLNDLPEEAPTESQALKKLKEERAADAERIRQDFIKSQRLVAGRLQAQKPLPKSNEDER